jgi:hypothetical protein
MIAFSAHWFVHVLASYHLSNVLWRCADVKAGGTIASLTYCLQLLDLLALWQQLNDRLEHGPHASDIQSCNYHDFAQICQVLTEGGNLYSKGRLSFD